MLSLETPQATNGEVRRDLANRSYQQAWADAPVTFRRAAERRGMEAKLDGDSRALEFREDYKSASYTPDMAASIDTHVDQIVEKYGFEHEELIRKVAADLQEPMKIEIERSKGMMLGRVVGWLIKSESKNILACIHALMHAIPRLASVSGYGSMRESARACGVSPEWMRRSRNEACHKLGVPVPQEGQKTAAAKVAYRSRKHFRKEKFHAKAVGNEPTN